MSSMLGSKGRQRNNAATCQDNILTPEKTAKKDKEAALAMKIEKSLSKKRYLRLPQQDISGTRGLWHGDGFEDIFRKIRQKVSIAEQRSLWTHQRLPLILIQQPYKGKERQDVVLTTWKVGSLKPEKEGVETTPSSVHGRGLESKNILLSMSKIFEEIWRGCCL